LPFGTPSVASIGVRMSWTTYLKATSFPTKYEYNYIFDDLSCVY
jgi:hypothetical protein